jgi:hypothetical protein
MENSTVQLGSTVARPTAAQHAGPSWNRVQFSMAQPADEVDRQSASAPHRRARGARDGKLAMGSPMAEVHQRDYAEHEHLLTHSPGIHTMAGSS